MKAAALTIVKTLHEAGFAAYLVGGCVRDVLMGIEPQDYDVATAARPEQVMGLFPRTIPIGIQFGVVLVLMEETLYEVATFRADGTYSNGRHPEGVIYTDDPSLDVQRRDFTINGLLYDPISDEILDFVGGENDIRCKRLKAIGDPLRRFGEDKLRMIRAVRFASRFRFAIEPQTQAAIVHSAAQIQRVSRERLREELIKLLTEGYAHEAFQLLDDTGLLEHFLPEVKNLKGVEQPPEFHPEGDVWVHTLLMLQIMDSTRIELDRGFNPTASSWTDDSKVQEDQSTLYPSVTLAMAVLLHDVGKPSTFELSDRIRFNNHCDEGARLSLRICERLRFSESQTDRITQLVRDHLKFKDLPQMRPSTMKRFLRQEGFDEHLELHRLDCLGSHGQLDLWRLARDIRNKLTPDEIRPKLLVSGDDLIRMGYQPGPIFKKILKSVEDAQLDRVLESRDASLRWIESRFPR